MGVQRRVSCTATWILFLGRPFATSHGLSVGADSSLNYRYLSSSRTTTAAATKTTFNLSGTTSFVRSFPLFDRVYVFRRNGGSSRSSVSISSSISSSSGGSSSSSSSSSRSRSSNLDAVRRSSVVLPRKRYSLTSFTWPMLVEIIEEEKDLSKLSRNRECQLRYELYLEKLQREWISVYDFILHSKFGFQKRKQHFRLDDRGAATSIRSISSPQLEEDLSANFLWEAVQPYSRSEEECETKEQPKIVLCPNDFPYHVAEGIHHYVLWKLNEDITNQEILDHGLQPLSDHFSKNQNSNSAVDFLYWKNPPNLKSLPDIDHVHILCLCKTPKEKKSQKQNKTKQSDPFSFGIKSIMP